MKTFFKTLRRQDGFTLVELMVVVAIIGLLSAVAIPNFQKYQARSKTSEAKLQLAAIYTAEASFYADYNMYAGCLRYMGYDPSEESASRYFTTGFATMGTISPTALTSAVTSGLNTATTECDTGTTAVTSMHFFPGGKAIGASLADNSHNTGTILGTQTVSDMTYTAGAAGIVHKSFTTNANSAYFTINQAKVISNRRNGF